MVHEHLFADVWDAARQQQTVGTIQPDAAYNALAVLTQVTGIGTLTIIKS